MDTHASRDPLILLTALAGRSKLGVRRLPVDETRKVVFCALMLLTARRSEITPLMMEIVGEYTLRIGFLPGDPPAEITRRIKKYLQRHPLELRVLEVLSEMDAPFAARVEREFCVKKMVEHDGKFV